MHEYAISIAGGPAAPVHATSSPRPELVVGPPPDFDGSDAWWSPEQLLLVSLAGCFDNTFRALAARAGVPIFSMSCRARGSLGKTSVGLSFTGIHLAVDIEVGSADAAKTHALLADAERKCIVRNSLHAPVLIESIVTIAAVA